MELSPGSVLERYTVEAVLGEGGMAIVYRVRHNQLGSLHAMKVLTVPGNAIRQRLLQEGRVQATLRHPNVVAVTDVVDVDGSPGLILEYVAGPPLDKLLDRYRPRLEEAQALGVGIISGVAFAHKHGLIHRDLKPANVLIASMENGPVPKVADFGLAKLLSPDSANPMQQTRSGVAMGTPSYMSPEQIRDAKSVDKRADVFALGAILYEMVTGHLAFPGGDLLTVFGAIADGRYVRVRELRADLPDHMVEAIEQSLAVNVAHRTPDCETLLRKWCGEKRPVAMLSGWSPGLMATIGLPASRPPAEGADPGEASPRTWAGDDGDVAQRSASQVSLESEYGDAVTDRARETATPPARRAVPRGALITGGLLVAALTAGIVVLGSGMLPGPGAPEAATSPPTLSSAPAAPAPAVPDAPVAVEAAAPPATEVLPPEVSMPVATPPATAVGPAVKSPAPRPAGSPEAGEPVVPKPAAPAPAAIPVAVAAPSPAPVAAATPAPAPPSNMATISLKGDAKRVWFESSAGRFPAGELPPGTYRVTAFFDSGEPVGVGEITVSAGEQRVLRCSSELMVCR